jgi:hypothetical protein
MYLLHTHSILLLHAHTVDRQQLSNSTALGIESTCQCKKKQLFPVSIVSLTHTQNILLLHAHYRQQLRSSTALGIESTYQRHCFLYLLFR